MGTEAEATAFVGGLHFGLSALLRLKVKLALATLGFGHAPTLYCIHELVVLAGRLFWSVFGVWQVCWGWPGWIPVLLLAAMEGLRGMAGTGPMAGCSPGGWVAWRVLGLVVGTLGASLVLGREGKEWGKVVAGAALGGGGRAWARADRRIGCG